MICYYKAYLVHLHRDSGAFGIQPSILIVIESELAPPAVQERLKPIIVNFLVLFHYDCVSFYLTYKLCRIIFFCTHFKLLTNN